MPKISKVSKVTNASLAKKAAKKSKNMAKDFQKNTLNAIQKLEFTKKTVDEILSECTTINKEKASKEILQWIIANVEQFIDNQMKIFKIDLILEAEDGSNETMPEVRKLQNLYRAIPDDEYISAPKDKKDIKISSRVARRNSLDKIVECRKQLDSTAEQIHECMKTDQELLEQLFKRMAFYYEVKALTSEGPLIQEQVGLVDIIKFEYEAFSVGVRVTNQTGGISSEHLIPEGFTIWVEISMKAKDEVPMSLF